MMVIVVIVVVIVMIMHLGAIDQLLAHICHSISTGLQKLQKVHKTQFKIESSFPLLIIANLSALRHDESAALDQLSFQGGHSTGDCFNRLEQCMQYLLFQFQRVYRLLFALQPRTIPS